MTKNEKFEQFWKAYPPTNGAKREKAKAKIYYMKAKCYEKQDMIIAAVVCQSMYAEGQRRVECFQPEFPYAWRWIRDERWEDEMDVKPKTKDYTCGYPGCKNKASRFIKGIGHRCPGCPTYEVTK